jgi:putative two-component system response regulator
MKKIFVVDDNNVNLLTAEETLSKHYDVFTLPSADAMFELLAQIQPDLIMLDILMPDKSGFDVIEELKADERYKNIPVIFLSGRSDPYAESRGFELGAVDFIAKPFSEIVLLKRLETHLRINSVINERTYYLKGLRDSLVVILSNMVENRDTVTGKHIQRTSKYIEILLNAMIEKGVYKEALSGVDVNLFVSSARLHDLGKICVSDLILNKPDKLSSDEYDIIKTHAAEGDKIIDFIIAESGDESFLQNAKLFASFHHERWDGKGYPYGLEGEEIPIQGRIMAIVDVYDALVSERPYKTSLTHEEAIKIIEDGKGVHFDPIITDIFIEINKKFEEAAV